MKNENISRRDFTIKMAAGTLAGLGGVMVAGKSVARAASSKRIPVALQLYTVRDLTGKDFAGTIKKVAEIGYDAVEFAGYGNLSAKEVKKLLDDNGLKCAGAHVGYEDMAKNLPSLIEFHKTIGNTFITCPGMPKEFRESGADGFKDFGAKMNEIGVQAKKSEINVCYHNHNFEFEKAGGKYLIEYLLESSDPSALNMELDVYWAQYAGADPVAFINKYPARCRLLHMKDMENDEKKSFAPVGAGIMDMKSIIKAGREAKVDRYIVEQDLTKGPVLEAIAVSLKNMRELLK